MTVKTFGAEFRQFYADADFWPEGAWHEDEEIEVDGLPPPEDLDEIPNTSKMTIANGVVLGLPDLSEPSLEAHFKRWRKIQTTVSFVVECHKDAEEAMRLAVRAAGGRLA